MDYPWLNETWNMLQNYYIKQRIPSAIIISGYKGIGKNVLTKRFVDLVLCHNPVNNNSCGKCIGCNLLKNNSHPDLINIETEDSNVIKIEQIRDLTTKLMSAPLDAKFKVAIIHDADQLQERAANALLKTLEEPLGQTIIILQTSKVSQIPITIRSRCSHLSIIPPNLTAISEWYKQQSSNQIDDGELNMLYTYSSGAPLAMMDMSVDDVKDIFSTIKNSFILKKISLSETCLALKQISTYDVVKASLITLQDFIRYNTFNDPAILRVIPEGDIPSILSNKVNDYNLYKLFDYHAELIKELDSGVVWQHSAIIANLCNRWLNLRK
jgi:DNA polymerase III delta' subunit